MYLIKNNTIILIPGKNILKFDTSDDSVTNIENAVADYYQISVHDLNDFAHDHEGKIMCCFLLHDLCAYSLWSLSIKYRINEKFLKNKITQTYKKCLQNEADMRRVIALQSVFFN